MLIDACIRIALGVFTGFLALMPAYSLPSLGGLGSAVGSAVAGANSVFPVVTLGLCLAAVVGLRLFIAAAAVISWIWDKIPFKFS